IPCPPPASAGAAGRPLGEIARQPRFIVAVARGGARHGIMDLVMNLAPLALIQCSLSVTDAALGLQWHLIGMDAPSFYTCTLIARFGVERVVTVGLGLIISSALVSLAGITLWNFWAALVLLGVGWNFAFIGATAMVTQCHRPNERNRVQAFNDFLVFG